MSDPIPAPSVDDELLRRLTAATGRETTLDDLEYVSRVDPVLVRQARERVRHDLLSKGAPA